MEVWLGYQGGIYSDAVNMLKWNRKVKIQTELQMKIGRKISYEEYKRLLKLHQKQKVNQTTILACWMGWVFTNQKTQKSV